MFNKQSNSRKENPPVIHLQVQQFAWEIRRKYFTQAKALNSQYLLSFGEHFAEHRGRLLSSPMKTQFDTEEQAARHRREKPLSIKLIIRDLILNISHILKMHVLIA